MTTTMTTHGTNTTYRYGCRCDQCREAHRAHQATYRATNVPTGLVDTAPVRAHIDALMGQGLTRQEIADAAGVTMHYIADLRYGRARQPEARCRRATAEAILAVSVGMAPRPKPVPVVSDAKTIADRANLAAFMRRIRRGRRAA